MTRPLLLSRGAVTAVILTALIVTTSPARQGRDPSEPAAVARAYLQAEYTMLKAAESPMQQRRNREAVNALVSELKKRCQFHPVSPLAGEASLRNEIFAIVGLTLARASEKSTLGFLRRVQHLQSRSLEVMVGLEELRLDERTMLGLSPPDLCADAKAWAGNGSRTISSAGQAFVEQWNRLLHALGRLGPSTGHTPFAQQLLPAKVRAASSALVRQIVEARHLVELRSWRVWTHGARTILGLFVAREG
jgi:hypothetical protein